MNIFAAVLASLRSLLLELTREHQGVPLISPTSSQTVSLTTLNPTTYESQHLKMNIFPSVHQAGFPALRTVRAQCLGVFRTMWIPLCKRSPLRFELREKSGKGLKQDKELSRSILYGSQACLRMVVMNAGTD